MKRNQRKNSKLNKCVHNKDSSDHSRPLEGGGGGDGGGWGRLHPSIRLSVTECFKGPNVVKLTQVTLFGQKCALGY